MKKWSEWLLYTRNLSPLTEAQYRRYMNRWLTWCDSEGVDATDPSLDALQRYVGLYLHQQKLKPVTRAVCVNALRSFYGYLAQIGLIDKPAALLLSPPKMGRALPKAMPAKGAERLMFAPDLTTFLGVRDLAIMAVLLGTGVRLSGVTGLHEEDLIFEKDGEVEMLSLLVTEKGKKQRIVPCPDETRLMLRAYMSHPELAAIDRVSECGRTILFVSTKNNHVPAHEYFGENRRIHQRSVHHMLKRYCRMCGIDPKFAHPHAFRHLYGKELAENDVDLVLRKQLLGHAKADTTEVYDNIASRKRRKIVQKSNPFNLVKSPATELARRLNRAGL